MRTTHPTRIISGNIAIRSLLVIDIPSPASGSPGARAPAAGGPFIGDVGAVGGIEAVESQIDGSIDGGVEAEIGPARLGVGIDIVISTAGHERSGEEREQDQEF